MEHLQEYKEESKVFEELKQLRAMILNFEEKLKSTENRVESPELEKLFEALSLAQSGMDIAKTDCSNPFFKSKYADLASIVKASRFSLAKNGLSVIQFSRINKGMQILHTRLCHKSGQWLESQMPINPTKPDIQTLGSTLTYLRRYMYASLVGVVSSGEDDDGEGAMKSVRSSVEQKPISLSITRSQLQSLSKELDGHQELLQNILKGFKISKLSDLLAKHYTQCITRIKEIKTTDAV